MAQIETGMVCGCGMPMSRNPHPDAGKPDMDGVAAGYEYECIPCLVATRNRVGASWRKAEAHAARLERANTVRRRRVKYLFARKNRLIEQQGTEILRLRALLGQEVVGTIVRGFLDESRAPTIGQATTDDEGSGTDGSN